MDLAVNTTVTIFRKTAKGHTEIETRANRLPLRQRSVLIIVDGRTPDRDLRKLAGPHVDAMFKELLEGGYIEPVSSYDARTAAPRAASSGFASSSASVPPATAVDGSPEPAGPIEFAPAPAEMPTWRRDAVRMLIDQVGPMGETLAMRIEATRNWSELKPLLLIGQQVIGNVRGRAAADAWKRRFIGP